MKLKAVLVAAMISVTASTTSFTASANEQLAVSLCEYVAADDKNRIRKTLKGARVKMRNVYDAISCNGNNLLRHAIASNAEGAGQYIVKNLPKSVLKDGSDISWAESNGHAGSPLIAIIKERAGL